MKKLCLYLDTSVYGGCLDSPFAAACRDCLGQARSGFARLIVSDVLLRELAPAPAEVREFLAGVPPSSVDRVPFSEEVIGLRDAYLAAGILQQSQANDAEHVASATVGGADVLVSLNFKHIAHFAKSRAFSGVNLLKGYPAVPILSPLEVARAWNV